MSNRRAVLVVDDRGASSPLGPMVQSGGYRVTALVSSGPAALEAAALDRPDLAILDIEAPLGGTMTGLELARRLRDHDGVATVLVASPDPIMAERAAVAGPLAYLVKPVHPAQLLATLRHVTARRARRSKRPTQPSVPRLRLRADGLDRLTPRELDVVRRLLDNGRVASIAEMLEVSPYTVRNHLRAVYRKLNVHSQVELIRRLTADDHEPASPPTEPVPLALE